MKGNHRGSAIVEVTLLVPIFIGCIYGYIMLFLFFMESGHELEIMSECLYEETSRSTESPKRGENLRKEGNVKIIEKEKKGEFFVLKMELRKDESDPVKNIRRWQLLGDLF